MEFKSTPIELIGLLFRGYLAMSKFGVVVMGPAGAGKVCGIDRSMHRQVLTTRSDHLLLCLDPTSSSQQTIMFLCQP